MSERRIDEENLQIWHEAAAENRALRLLQIMERAEGMALGAPSDEGDHDLRVATPTLYCSEPVPDSAPFAEAMALDEQMALCRALPPVTPPAEHPPAPPAPRVARLSGPIFDRAFQGFSPLLGMGRPIYLSSLGELLEELAAGNAEFALFPIEDAKGMRFLHFYEEFDRLELHVTHTCNVPSEESGKSIRFALLSKQYAPTGKAAGTQMLEYRLSGEDRGALCRLLCAAAYADIRLHRADSIPSPYVADGFDCYVVLSVGERGDEALLGRYLGIALPRAVPVGRYMHLNS